MAEAKNNFLKAKMNQDLDDRLLPNGEYRTAQNVLVGKSEEDSAGTLQNIKGNTIVSGTQLGIGVYGQIEIIGYFMDPTNDRIITFTTDWTGTAFAPADASCAIRSYNVNNGSYTTLVEGYFLNFSTINTIVGVSLLEDLLFWTDNRNQPRKINVATALREGVSHYYKENNISVSKYNPYKAILLLKEQKSTVISVTSQKIIEIAENNNITIGMTFLASREGNETIFPYDYITVTNVEPSATVGQTTVTLSSDEHASGEDIEVGDNVCFLISTMSDQGDDPTWPGDPDYLEDKFVRFGYRFKFEDNEYSVYAPFTQIAFIPKQKGYFLRGNEANALSSTIVTWMENNVNNVDLIIPLPDKGVNIINSYKITEIDILYKESDSLAVKVLDTINVDSINNEENFYIYSYQSRKPIRTLPEAQTVRVFDKVPVKAKTQEIISNRVVYGNFLTKPSPPSTISYTVNFQPKVASCDYPSFIEYPNHNVKQNRNYQVGWVLADKFGRQSSVILSPILQNTIGFQGNFGGSTIYAEYMADDPVGSGIPDPSFMPRGVRDWFGNSLVIQVNDPIQGGDSGLYANPSEDGSGFAIDSAQSVTISDTQYTFTLDAAFSADHTALVAINDSLRGQYCDYTKVTNVDDTNAPTYVVTTEDRISDIYLPQSNLQPSLADVKYSYIINPNGWYSYKIVVKQLEQDYYNVYLPSSFSAAGLLSFSTDTDDKESYITLINDNINKVPRDLAEVGPDQKQYRSSVKLYGRVNPTTETEPSPIDYTFSNTQYFPLRSSDISTVVGNANDLIGDNTTEQQFTGIVGQTSSGSSLILKNVQPTNVLIPRGAIISETTAIVSSPDTFVQNYTLLGNGYNSGTPEEGMWARVQLSEIINAAVGNSITFATSPGAYLYQGDSNPIIARIVTNKQFGINYTKFNFETTSSASSRFQLAVYETDPFVSALDIYWESSTQGLISDINEEVAVGYDGPTQLEPTAFSLFENDPIGTIVTQTFYPLDQNGVQIPQTSLNSFSVTDGDGNVTQSGVLFTINQITSGVDQGAYQITTASEFAYLWGSYQKDVYTFSIEVQNTNPATEWEFQTLSFTGRLKNIEPDITLVNPAYYTFDNSFGAFGTVIADFGVYFDSANPVNPVNGTINTPQVREDLVWDITAGNSAGYFVMYPEGFIKLTTAGLSAPYGSYPLEIRLTDASNINRYVDPAIYIDPGAKEVRGNIQLTKGFQQTNFPNPLNGGEVQINDFCGGGVVPDEKNIIFYLSDFSYSGLTPEDAFDFLSDLVVFPPNLSVGGPLAPALKSGEFVLGFEDWFINPCTTPPTNQTQFRGSITLRAYKRPISPTTGIPIGGTNAPWVEAQDLNGVLPQDSIGAWPFLYLETDLQTLPDIGGANSWLAYGDTMYEYAWLANFTRASGFLPPQMVGNVYVRDLHYPGTDFSQIVYQFTDGVNPTLPSSIKYYADTPFAEYNTRYFTSPSLITPYAFNPPGDSGNTSRQYVFKRLGAGGANDTALLDAQFNWIDFSGGGGPTLNPPDVWFCRSSATWDVNNTAVKTGVPPYLPIQKSANATNGWPPINSNFQPRGPGYPGSYAWGRSRPNNSSVNPQPPIGFTSWGPFFPV